MVGGLNRLLPKEINANRFFWDSHWLEIWSNHFCPSMGPNGGNVAMDSVRTHIAWKNTYERSSLSLDEESGTGLGGFTLRLKIK
jgi:hypothetical protein